MSNQYVYHSLETALNATWSECYPLCGQTSISKLCKYEKCCVVVLVGIGV